MKTEEVERISSDRGDYDIVVAKYRSVTGYDVLMMVETGVQQSADECSSAYAASYADPELAHSNPMKITMSMVKVMSLAIRNDYVCVLAGLGAGLVQEHLRRAGIQHLTVEPEDAVVELAKRHWNFQGQVEVSSIQDFLIDCDNDSIDCLLLDCYNGHNGVTPLSVLKDYWPVILHALSDRGCIIVNGYEEDAAISTMHMSALETRCIEQGLHLSVFLPLWGVNTSENPLIVISKIPLPAD